MSELIEALSGRWVGRKCVYLTWLPNLEHWSDSTVRVAGVVNAHALELRYDWSYEDTPRHGALLLVLNPDNAAASAAWIDSWHQSKSLLQLQGTHDALGIDLNGQYPVAGHPDWGWRMRLELSDAELHLRMYNRSPEGVEELAVHIHAQRLGD